MSELQNTLPIFNFVPSTVHNASFPCLLESKGYIFRNPNHTEVIFYHTNGTISVNSTLTFKNETTNIPLPYPQDVHPRLRQFYIVCTIYFIAPPI